LSRVHGGRVGTSGKEMMGKGGKRVKKCLCMYVNAKMILVETVPGIGGRR
jgi:hypothetical protein